MPITPENIVKEANTLRKDIYGNDYTPGATPKTAAASATEVPPTTETVTQPNQ
jgi:hypothetical protein